MIDHRRIIFSAAHVGHHGEIISKLCQAWFNPVQDDVYSDDSKALRFKKASITPYGKYFLYGVFFLNNKLSQVIKDGVEIRRRETRHLPTPTSDGPSIDMNVQWPMCSTLHLKMEEGWEEYNMIDQLNTADQEYLTTITPYKRMDEECYKYIHFRYRHFSLYYDSEGPDVETLEDTKKEVSYYSLLTNAVNISLIYDIVHGTKYSLDELEEYFGTPSVTAISRLSSWLDVAHTVYKEKFLGDPKWHTLTY